MANQNKDGFSLIHLPNAASKHYDTWTQDVIFTCYICGLEIKGVNDTFEHAKNAHPDTYNEDKPASCPTCPKTYSETDHLLIHIWKRHLVPMYPDDMPSSPPISKEQEDEDLFDNQIQFKCDPEAFPEGTDWSSQVILSCYLCGLETDGFRQSVEHVRANHPQVLTRDKNAPCILCPKLFGRMDHLKKHVWSHVNKVNPGVPPHFIIATPNADGKSVKPQDDFELDDVTLNNLIRFKMDPDDFPEGVDWSTQSLFNCYLCSVEVDGFRDGVKHVRSCHPDTLKEDKACPCILCPKRFARMDHLKNHVFSHVNRVRPGIAKHNMSTFVRSSTSRSSLKHRLFPNTTEDQDDEDEEDDEEFDQFTNQMQIKHEELIFKAGNTAAQEEPAVDADWSTWIMIKCRLCHKLCDGFHMAASHMKHIHPCHPQGNGQMESCPVCPKTFEKINHLKNHVWRHVNKVFPGTDKHADMLTSTLGRGKPSWTEEREWPCKRCDKQIKGITDFVDHLDTMHPNQCGIVCPICDKELPSKRRLKIHVVIHSDKKATCPHCGKAFSEAYKLRRHLREVHDNMKDHVCSTCGKTFARADKLFQHELIHVSKSQQPVEWMPITTVKSNEPNLENTTDESSDSSTDNEEDKLKDIEAFLQTEIKENDFVKLEQTSMKQESDQEESDYDFSDHQLFSENEDDDYVPDFKRKKQRPRKEDDDQSWMQDHTFHCNTCGDSVQGFQGALDHANDKHKDEHLDEPSYPCILCPLNFGRKELIKKHLHSHVLDNTDFDFSDKHDLFLEDDKASKSKRITENKNILAKIHQTKWDLSLTCGQCQESLENIKSAHVHMKTQHPSTDGSIACPLCEAAFQGPVQFKIHIWRHFNSYEAPKRGRKKGAFSWEERKIWTCQWCNDLIEGFTSLIQHRRQKHHDRASVYECPSCEDGDFSSKDELLKHLTSQHKKEKPSCQLCSKTFFNNNKLRRHLIEVHEGRKNHMCNECGKCFARPDKLRDHEKTHQTKRRVKDEHVDEASDLEDLDELVNDQSDYEDTRHENEDETHFQKRLASNQSALDAAKLVDAQDGQAWHQKATFNCQQCQVVMTSVALSAQHMTMVHKMSTFACILCMKSFATSDILTIHLWRHFQKAMAPSKQEGNDRVPCQFCDKFFAEGNKMRRHVIEVHEGRKSHKCEECGKSFARAEKLKQHQLLHADNGNRPFLCHQCGRGFGRQEHVTRHQKICGKKKSKSRLRLRADAPITDEELEKIAIELGIHNNLADEGPDAKTPCKFCEKSFRNKRYMMEHYVRHHRAANQKLPHRCEVCGKGFKVIRDLERHHNRPNTKYFHSEEYLSLKYVCPEDGCCKRFKRERALSKHLLIHNNIRNFKCENCNMAFCTRQTLRTHAKMQHNVILPTESKKGKKLGPRLKKTNNNIQQPLATQDISAHPTTVEPDNNWVAQGYFTNSWISLEQTLNQQPFTKQRISTFPIEIRDQDNISVENETTFQDMAIKPVTSQKKPRMSQSVLTEEQKQMVTEEMTDANLGLLCNVCGKIFKSKDALDFHIMYTKLPGHEVLQQQRVKNNYAQEAMRISAKLSDESLLMDDYGPATPLLALDQQPPTPLSSEIFDSKTGVFVKREELASSNIATVKKAISKSKIFKCMECHRGFKREIKLISHVAKKHSSVSNSGSSIKKVVIPEGSLKLTPNGCPDCNMIFAADSSDQMLAHFSQKPHEWQGNKCPVLTCDMSFASKDKLLDHLGLGKHGQDCPQCGKSFAKLDNLELHVRSHWTERPFACDQCEKSYKDAPSLYSHMQSHHSSSKRSHLCSECGASFMKSDHLKRHINSTHRKIKTIQCNFCEMMFSDKYKAKVHERKHTGESPFMCDICSKTFKRKEALDNHAIVHQDLPKDFKCVTCGAAFNSQQYLNRHISRHFAEKKHKCRDCDMAFIDKRDYVVHINKVHANHRPFACSTCGMAYKTKQGLTSHLKSHPNGACINASSSRKIKDNNKAFACDQCDKKFTKESRLNQHQKTHAPVIVETQTFVLKPATNIIQQQPVELSTNLQQALSQHQKTVGIQQNLHQVYAPYPMANPAPQQQQGMMNQDQLSNEFYQHYAATFNHMYKQS